MKSRRILTSPVFFTGFFDAQIIVIPRLSSEEHSNLRLLCNNIDIHVFNLFMDSYRQFIGTEYEEKARAIMDASVAAYKELYKNLRSDPTVHEALLDLMKDDIEEREQKAAQKNTLESIKNLMETLQMPAQEVMEKLKIPAEEHSFYLNMIQ